MDDIHFIFNGDGKVSVFRVDNGFVARLSEALSPEDIALVLGNARIAHFMLCIDDELLNDELVGEAALARCARCFEWRAGDCELQRDCPAHCLCGAL